MNNGKVFYYITFFVITLVGVSFFGSKPFSAPNEKIIAEGKAGIEKSYLASNPKISGESIIDFKIIERDGKYFWTSNESKPLIRIEKNSAFLNKYPQTVFLNPDGDGMIIIVHEKSSADKATSCHFKINNYREYRINERGGLTPYSGSTNSYPFPKPHDPNKCGW